MKIFKPKQPESSKPYVKLNCEVKEYLGIKGKEN